MIKYCLMEFMLPIKLKNIIRFIFLSCLIFGVNTQKGLCQSNPDNFAKMVDILPPPPNAAALAKAGLFALNKNTGAPSINIPLYNLKGRKISLDISLSYSSNGIKVDEIASRVGMGWTINAGGVISRTIRGYADELWPRKYPWATVGENWSTYNYMKMIAHDLKDAEPDMFNFNFNGYSGGFVLDGNMLVVTVPHTNLKIDYSFAGTSWNFKITAPDGIMYFFGGSSATEKTKRLTTCGRSYENPLPTAWYLTKVQHPNGEIITLNYNSLSYSYDTGLSETATYAAQGASGSGACPQPNSGVTTVLCKNYVNTTGVILSEIVSSTYGKIKFNYTSRPDCADKIISSIEQWNNISNIKINSFVFGYTNYNTGTYNNYNGEGTTVPYLTSLDDMSSDDAQTKTHRFVYDDPGGRSCRLAFAQDHWGYFNGKNNTTLLPYFDYLKSRFPAATANREADLNYAVKGMLTKIIYPTGGADSIIYEANTIAGTEYIKPYHELSCSVTGTFTNTLGTKEIPFTVTPQIIQIVANMTCSGTCNLPGVVQVINEQNVTIHSSNIALGSPETINLYVGSGNYTLRIQAAGAASTNNVTLQYYPVNASNESENIVVGGVRVKETLSSNPGEMPQYKKFYYGNLSTLNKSSLFFSPAPDYQKFFIKRYEQYQGWDGVYYCEQDIASLHSNSLVNLCNYGGCLASYGSVVESKGEDFEGGGIQSKFYTAADYAAQVLIGAPLFNASQTNGSIILNGKPTEEILLKKTTTNALVPVKKTKYVYSYTEGDVVSGFVANQRLSMLINDDSTGALTSYFMNSYDMSRYDIHSPWIILDSLYEINYDENGENPLINSTKYFYDNNVHLQVTSSETRNSKNDLLKTYNQYPADFQNTAPYSTMLSNYIITPVIDVRRTSNNTGIEEIKNNYTDWGNSNFEVASIERSVMGNPLTNIGVITNYDKNGNILEYTGKDGVINSIIWGYKNTFPVAKITGANYSQALALVDTSAIQTLDGPTLLSALNSLRTNLAGSIVITYTYKPLIGVSTITDANDKTNTYEYDVFNRLKLIKDQDNNLVRKIEYSYNGPDTTQSFTLYYNTQVSRKYISRDCDPNAISDSVTYTVPAGKWFSITSAVLANAKAAADTMSNGQGYADRHGTCTIGNCNNCNSSNCIGVNKKCVGGFCETGYKFYTSSVLIPHTSSYTCTYRFVFSYGPPSEEYVETSSTMCVTLEP